MNTKITSSASKFPNLAKKLLALSCVLALAASANAQSDAKPEKKQVQERVLPEIYSLVGAVASDSSQAVEARHVDALPELAADNPELEFVKASMQ